QTFVTSALDQSAQCATAFRHSPGSLSICVAGFSYASFDKRKNLSLQNLDRAHFASIRVSPCLAHHAATRSKDFEIGSETLRRHSSLRGFRRQSRKAHNTH